MGEASFEFDDEFDSNCFIQSSSSCKFRMIRLYCLNLNHLLDDICITLKSILASKIKLKNQISYYILLYLSIYDYFQFKKHLN